jgi:hypothetical protein
VKGYLKDILGTYKFSNGGKAMKKLWVMFIFLGYHLGVYAMDASRKRDVTITEPSSRCIRVPALKNFRANSAEQSYTDETIDLNQIACCTKESFLALSQAHYSKNLQYILARVTTCAENNVENVGYCDAHALNLKLMGSYHVEPRSLCVLDHPITNQPLKNVEYYTLSSGKEMFRFMFSYADLCDNSSDSIYLKYVLCANQMSDRRLQKNAQLWLLSKEVDPADF